MLTFKLVDTKYNPLNKSYSFKTNLKNNQEFIDLGEDLLKFLTMMKNNYCSSHNYFQFPVLDIIGFEIYDNKNFEDVSEKWKEFFRSKGKLIE